jgi:multiple sugar transport system permease protein
MLAGLAWTSPWLIGAAVFVFAPMAMSLYFAFTDYPLLEPPYWCGLDNFRRLFQDPSYWQVVKNTVLYAVLAIPLTTLLALILAAMLAGGESSSAQPSRASRLLTSTYRACIFIPTLVPLIASAMVWMWLFNGESGLLNRLLAPLFWALQMHPPSWIVDQHYVMPAMVIMSLWGVGQSMVVYVAAIQDIPRQLYEAARIDGMGTVNRFIHVTMPMVSPAILFNVISLTIGAVQIFAVPYVMFRQPDGTNPSGYFYTMYLYDNAFVYGKMGYASAMAWIQLLVVLSLTGVLLFASRKLVHYARV